jgi:predicted nucleotidyltransferase
VDFGSPIEALMPGARGRILAVLAETTAQLNVRTISRLAEVSLAQTSRILPDLAMQGMVERTDVPPSVLYRLVPEHLVSRALLDLTRSSERALVEMGDLAADLDPAPVSVIVFGSLARGEADAASDIDVIFVRPDAVDPDGDEWIDALQRWRTAVRRLTGNAVEIIDVGEAEVERALRSRRPLWRDASAEGTVVLGRSIADMKRSA